MGALLIFAAGAQHTRSVRLNQYLVLRTYLISDKQHVVPRTVVSMTCARSEYRTQSREVAVGWTLTLPVCVSNSKAVACFREPYSRRCRGSVCIRRKCTGTQRRTRCAPQKHPKHYGIIVYSSTWKRNFDGKRAVTHSVKLEVRLPRSLYHTTKNNIIALRSLKNCMIHLFILCVRIAGGGYS